MRQENAFVCRHGIASADLADKACGEVGPASNANRCDDMDYADPRKRAAGQGSAATISIRWWGTRAVNRWRVKQGPWPTVGEGAAGPHSPTEVRGWRSMLWRSGVCRRSPRPAPRQSRCAASDEGVRRVVGSGRRRALDSSAVIEIDPFLCPRGVLGLRELCLCMGRPRAATFTQ